MEYLEIIEKELPLILDDIKKEIIKDETIYEYVKKDRLDAILEKQKKLLYKFFIEYKNEIKDENFCWNFYKEFDIPFSIVYKSLTTLKNSLIKKLLNKLNDKHKIFEIEHFINNLLNMVAKIYIKKDISNTKINYKTKFQKYLLFNAHSVWINKLVKSIKEDDLSNFPLISSKECNFNKYLDYPESLMVCMDTNLCDHLHSIHDMVHKNANALYLFYQRKEYYQAYIVYKELIENIVNFDKTILELYFLTYNNLEESFFKLVELLCYNKPNMSLTLIDIKKLKFLNTNYGELTINKVLEIIDQKLQKLVHDKERDILLIKGSTADYYMLNVGLNDEKIKYLNDNLYKIVNNTYHIDSKEIEIRSTIATLSLQDLYEKNRDELTKLMLYIKDEAKEKTDSYYISSDKDKKRLCEWLNKSYSDLDFVTKKLNNKEMDVVFQPIVNTKNGKVEVLEALARIKDRNKLIPAGSFIDTIYSIDKIEVLDNLVLEILLEKKEKIIKVASKLFVNVSYKSLLNSKYKNTIKRFLNEFKDCEVIFELTEQNIIENIDNILKLHKEYDIHFAVDDFGSGYSSLKTVSDLAREGVLKVLKMDGEIIKNIDDDEFGQKIVQVISRLSETLGLYSVGEFVETKKVLKLLKNFDVTYAQGYYLSKPKTIDELLVEKYNEKLR